MTDEQAFRRAVGTRIRPESEAALRKQVGRRLRLRRIWLDLSQDEVAQRARVTRNFVSAIERSAQGLDAWRLWAVADALGATLDWLLTGPDDAATTPTPGERVQRGSFADGQRTVITTESSTADQEWPVPGPHIT